MSIRVIYSDFAPGAETDSTVTATDQTYFSDPAYVFGTASIRTKSLITLEPKSWRLDGSRSEPVSRSGPPQKYASVSYWSNQMSDTAGRFQTPPTITIILSQRYSSAGIGIRGWEPLGEWCSEVNIKWYRSGSLIAQGTFYPTSASYFCEQVVERFDKIVVTLLRTNIGRRRAKIDRISLGIERVFTMRDLKNSKITKQTSLTGLRLPASTFDFTLRDPSNTGLLFQQMQSITVYSDDQPLGEYFVQSSKHVGEEYQVRCLDVIGVAGESRFSGADYTAGALSTDIIRDIFNGSGILPYPSTVPEMTVYGILKPQSRREALQQLLLATGGIITDWYGNASIDVLDATGPVNLFGPDRTFPGASYETAPKVSEVRVTAHQYSKNGDSWDDAPVVYSVKNPDLGVNDKHRDIVVQDATLVDGHNARDIAQRLYDFYNARVASTAIVVWDNSARGSRASFATRRGSTPVGNISKVEIKLSNTLVAKVYTDDEVISNAT